MSDPGSQHDGSYGSGGLRTLSDEEVAQLWQVFTAGDVAPCPRDGAPVALSVDGSTKSYRLVCTRCGTASLWFETAPAGIQDIALEVTVRARLKND